MNKLVWLCGIGVLGACAVATARQPRFPVFSVFAGGVDTILPYLAWLERGQRLDDGYRKLACPVSRAQIFDDTAAAFCG